MDTKLTLKLNKQVIEKAKEYAKLNNRSLSRMIESYLKTLTERNFGPSAGDFEISPFIKSLKTGVNIPSDFDEKKVYKEHLAKKYK